MAHTVSGIECILLDIEGTICPISFVKDTLFPYALEALPDVLASKWDDADFKPYRDAFPEEYRSSPRVMEEHVQDLTRRDVKIAYLKNLQGYLWQSGYENHVFSTPMFPDLVPAFSQWQAASRKIAIYSSGSVFAQKLLFRHVQDPSSSDPSATISLEDRICDWFDTTNAGLKTQKDSYQLIANKLRLEARQVLFFSDNVNEVKAAKQAGMDAFVVDRPGNAPLSEGDRKEFTVVTSLAQVNLSDR